DQNVPTDLLKDILSRLGLKANIKASTVCKTWLEAAISVWKLQPRPWLFYRQRRSEDEYSPAGTYILFDPLRCQKHELNFPELENDHKFCYSRDGWLLVKTYHHTSVLDLFLLNPFTREHIYLPLHLPEGPQDYLAFSAAPTSSSCLVISLYYKSRGSICYPPCFVISTWRPGETLWTNYVFAIWFSPREWTQCVFSNGMFYWLSDCGDIGVFDPSRKTWNILPVKPCPAKFGFMMEHEGDIFVMTLRRNKNPWVVKLNFKREVWEEKRKVGGLTVFASE
ncbi:unnamed protein product, partial [Arabidopsis halleri]